MPIEPNVQADETLSQRIAGELRTSVLRGDYPPGCQLPSGRTLMRKYGVARQTVQNAFDVLRAEGLTVTRPGAGTFVRDRPTVIQLSRNHATFDTVAAEVVTRTEPADQHSAEALGLHPGEQLLVREQVIHANGTPVHLATSRLPQRLAASAAHPATDLTRPPATDEPSLNSHHAHGAAQRGRSTVEARPDDGHAHAESRPLGGRTVDKPKARWSEALSGRTSASETSAMDASTSEPMPGSAGGRVIEYVSTRPANPAEATSLRLTSGAPVLCVTRIEFDQRGTAIELSDLVLSGERYQLIYELPTD